MDIMNNMLNKINVKYAMLWYLVCSGFSSQLSHMLKFKVDFRLPVLDLYLN